MPTYMTKTARAQEVEARCGEAQRDASVRHCCECERWRKHIVDGGEGKQSRQHRGDRAVVIVKLIRTHRRECNHSLGALPLVSGPSALVVPPDPFPSFPRDLLRLALFSLVHLKRVRSDCSSHFGGHWPFIVIHDDSFPIVAFLSMGSNTGYLADCRIFARSAMR